MNFFGISSLQNIGNIHLCTSIMIQNMYSHMLKAEKPNSRVHPQSFEDLLSSLLLSGN